MVRAKREFLSLSTFLFLVVLLATIWATNRVEAGEKKCQVDSRLSYFYSPQSVIWGDEVRFVVASDYPVFNLQVKIPELDLSLGVQEKGGGPPYWVVFHINLPKSTQHKKNKFITVNLMWDSKDAGCVRIRVRKHRYVRKKVGKYVWKERHSWSHGWENLYSAWIEHLFATDRNSRPSWRPMHQVTRDRKRNLLFNHLGLDEDSEKGLVLEPDCADNPFFLRAYFSWKLGLPFGFHQCTKGTPNSPPRCTKWYTNRQKPKYKSRLKAFQYFLRLIMDKIHSASARTALDDDKTDLYPVELTREALRPGTVYADPYGHTLVLVKWFEQTDKETGMLLAVDAQPDGTVGIKRYWRGNFLFTHRDVIGGPGFKHFRPIVVRRGQLHALTNKELQKSHDYHDFSLEQATLDSQQFYDKMERIINPKPLDPVEAYYDLHKALYEQLQVRVRSVENGEKFMKKRGFKPIDMPEGREIFQTVGPWEDYSTPCRDMRLLIAMDVLEDFPDRVVRDPQAFKIPDGVSPDDIREKLLKLHNKWCNDMKITYTRSDGSKWTLTMCEILQRKTRFEMAYNPNDCVEIRWGAKSGTEEYSTCNRHAPKEQLERMQKYRIWFRERRRPGWNEE